MADSRYLAHGVFWCERSSAVDLVNLARLKAGTVELGDHGTDVPAVRESLFRRLHCPATRNIPDAPVFARRQAFRAAPGVLSVAALPAVPSRLAPC